MIANVVNYNEHPMRHYTLSQFLTPQTFTTRIANRGETYGKHSGGGICVTLLTFFSNTNLDSLSKIGRASKQLDNIYDQPT